MFKSQLFVTGMFRSGTTLLARMLNTHKSICMASDPFAPIFKCFRNEIAQKKKGGFFDNHSPLNDYYFNDEQKILFKSIQSQNFNIPLKIYNIDKIRRKVMNHCLPYSPKIIDHLRYLDGDTYDEIFNSGFKIIKKVYGKGMESLIGIKEVWTNEFVPHFISSFKNSKVIIVVRDPRAITSSNYATQEHRYPFLFLGRQWRKLSVLGDMYNSRYDNVYLLKYEDLIKEPKTTTRNLCGFLEIDFDDSLIDHKKFIDGAGQTWLQNSSYNQVKRGFNKVVLNKWKKGLNEKQVSFIEGLCFFEMEKLGYKTIYVQSIDDAINAIKDFNEINKGIAAWIKPYVSKNHTHDYLLEADRIINYDKNYKSDTLY